MPEDWKTYSLDYHYGDTVYRIAVMQTWIADGATAGRPIAQ